MKENSLEVLFHDALALAPDDRARLVDEVCERDSALGKELREMLRYASSQTLLHDLVLRPSPRDEPAHRAELISEPIEHYEIIREVGRGGMGVVLLSRDTRLRRLVAIKVLRIGGGASSERFIEEARVTARCRHESIVVIYDIGVHHGQPYMVLEYLDGANLREEMRASRISRPQPGGRLSVPAMPVAHVVERITPVVRAMCHAHAADVIHCDLKPENIFVTRDGAIKVLDFGIAQAVADTVRLTGERRGDEREQDAPVVVGTPLYMSPEQWGAGPVGPHTDLWAVGMLLYEMVAGRHPLLGLSFHELRESVTALDQPVPPVASVVGEVGEIGAIIDACLCKRADARPRSAADLLDRLDAVLQARPRAVTGVAATPESAIRLVVCDLNIHQCTGFTRAQITDDRAVSDRDERAGYQRLIAARASSSDDSDMAALRSRVARWIPCEVGEPLFKRTQRTEIEPIVALMTVQNRATHEVVLHTLEVELFARDWLSRAVQRATSRLIEMIADYAFEIAEPDSLMPLIPNIAVAPGDTISLNVRLDIALCSYSLRMALVGSHGARIHTGVLHVW